MSIAERLALAPELRDISKWPGPEDDDVPESERDLYLRRKEAVVAYLDGTAFSAIADEHGVPKSEVYRLLDRCLTEQRNGTMFGFYALVPGTVIGAYQRTAKIDPAHAARSRGLAGAFLQLMAQHEGLQKYVENKALHSRTKSPRLIARAIRKDFLRKCAKVRAPNEYPFNTDDQAIRPLARYIERVLLQHYGGTIRDDLSDETSSEPLTAQPSTAGNLRPFEEVEHDGHNGDFFFVIKLRGKHDEWVYTTPMKLWLLLPLDRGSRAMLGYAYRLGSTNYPAISVMRSFASIYEKWEPKELTIPGLAYKDGAGFPSGVVPAARGVFVDLVCFDNAKANKARLTTRSLTRTLGATVNFGRAGEPIARPFVERLNQTLETLGFRRLPIGFNPKGPKEERERAMKAACDHAVTPEELEQVLDVMLANYNADAHSDLVNRSPNEYLKMWFSRTVSPIRSVEDPESLAKRLLRLELIKFIRGGGDAQRAPYIQWGWARYSNDVLEKLKNWSGMKCRIVVDIDDDIRFVRAFLRTREREVDIGILRAKPPWHLTPHTWAQRQMIQKANRISKIIVPPGSDMVQAFKHLKQREAAERRTAANDLARLGPVRKSDSSGLKQRDAIVRVSKKHWVSIK